MLGGSPAYPLRDRTREFEAFGPKHLVRSTTCFALRTSYVVLRAERTPPLGVGPRQLEAPTGSQRSRVNGNPLVA